jgi:hypothetical protein
MPSVYRKVGPMLRITHDDTTGKQGWTLCGRLSGPWVGELRSAWERLGGRSNKTNVVDLTGVISIDEQGEALLRAMKADGARFIARGVDMKHILAHLRSKARPSLRRALTDLEHAGDCSSNEGEI